MRKTLSLLVMSALTIGGCINTKSDMPEDFYMNPIVPDQPYYDIEEVINPGNVARTDSRKFYEVKHNNV